MKTIRTMLLASAMLASPGIAQDAAASLIRVTITNTAPAGGLGLAPFWVAFHDGGFDAFTTGTAASAGIQQSAEDGSAAGLIAAFGAPSAGSAQVVSPGGPLFPGASRSFLLNADLSAAGRYFSFVSMVVVSNDFFVGNDDPQAIDLANLSSTGGVRTIQVATVYDAGTEVEDFNFSLANGAFNIAGGQGGPNQGTDENGVVHMATGTAFPLFLGQNNVPNSFDFGVLNFNNYSIARIDIQEIPEPGSLALLLAGTAGLLGARRRAWRRRA